MTGHYFSSKNLTMAVEEERSMPKGSKLLKQSIIFLLLTFVPVNGFTLRSCYISFNIAKCVNSQLRAVPRDVPSTVKGFDLSGNKISRIQASDFRGFRILTQLDLNINTIKQIDAGAFIDLISLKTLNLNRNKLDGLGDGMFDGLSNLTELRISGNNIKAVAPTSLISLKSLLFLDISNNKLHNVTIVPSILQQLPNLQKLLLQHNYFNVFRSRDLTNSSLQLAVLDLSQNPIAFFQITADIFSNLTWLNLARTPKKMKWDVPDKRFLNQVSTLDISWFGMPVDDVKKLLETVNSSLTILRMDEMKYNSTALINASCTFPTLSTLQLRRNKFTSVTSDMFHLCTTITELDLKDNLIQDIREEAFRSLQRLRILDLSRNKLVSVPAAVRNLSTLSEIDLSKNNINKLGCNDFTNLTNLRQLSLHLNSISALSDCVFRDLTRLQVLKLQTNGLVTLNGAFKKYLTNLQQLRLNGNKLTAIKYGEFKGLTSLRNLSLHENQIKTLVKGSFIGLSNLTDLQLQINKLVNTELNKGAFNDLIHLRRLDLRENLIRYADSSSLPQPPFSKLSSLESLSVPANSRRGKGRLPSNFLQGLKSLLTFNARNMQLLSIPKDMFKYTPRLQLLDVSSNDLEDLSPDLFSPIQGLKSLYISRTVLRSLDFLKDANLTELEFLQSRKNAYSVISEEVIRALPALIYVDLQGNSFTCDCDNAWFLQWALMDNRTQVFDAYNFECNYPRDLKGTKLLDLDVSSCSVDTDFICFVSTTCVILLFMAVSFGYQFLRWQLVYAYYLFLAYLFDSKNKNRQAPAQYDAFVSYNIHDEPWVVNELLPKLEGEQGWKLCLHHRDFEPGKPIIENITDAIYGSRKTICVISRKYLESEWCSREIQVASFRLFDEHKDVLVLVFLEELPRSQLSPYHGLRRLLKRRTYLSWLQAQPHTALFWEKLRQALSPNTHRAAVGVHAATDQGLIELN